MKVFSLPLRFATYERSRNLRWAQLLSKYQEIYMDARECVRPVAGGYPGSLCLMARGHPSATSGSARASCKAWEPAGGRGALGAACAELRSSSAYCSRWWRVETSSVRGRRLTVQVPVSGSEPSYLRRVKTHRLMLHILTDLSKSRLRKTVCSLFTGYDETLVLW